MVEKKSKNIKIDSMSYNQVQGFAQFYSNIKKYNEKLDNVFELELADTEIAGFGNQVIRIKKRFHEKLICYINEKGQFFFPKVMQYNDFLEVYNLVETFKLFCKEEKKADSI